MKTTFSLESHTALISGSSKGIGNAIAHGFEAAGADVLYHGRCAEHLPDNVTEDKFIAANLLDEAGPVAMIDEAFARRPDLDTFVANAGSYFDQAFLELSLDRWRKTMQLNVEATFLACQAFSQKLVEQKRKGSIVIISSTNGFQAEQDSIAYDTSKGALRMLTLSMAMSLAPHGIRVNGVAPGLIRTPLTSSSLDPEKGRTAHYKNKILLERIGEPEDCAGPCAFLASDAASYMTGHIMVVDGGLTVGQIGRQPTAQ